MITIAIPVLLLLFYYLLTRNYDYWSKRKVKHEKPIPLFGNALENVFLRKSVTMQAMELYNKYPNEKVIGFYRGPTPELIVRDLDIVKRILTADFAYFYPRGLGRNPEIEQGMKNLFHVDGDTWKLLRQRLTPAFTSAKLKAMFPLVVKCAEKLQLVGENIVEKGGECDVRELMARFTTEFIGACGFGIEMNTINNEHSLFRELGRNMFARTRKNIILAALWDVFPGFRSIFHRFLAETANIDAVTEIFQNIRKQRNFKPSGRNDFVDLILELESKGKIVGDSIEHKDKDGKPKQVEMELTLRLMAAQILVFFAAGFETSSSATSYTLHQLAYHPEEQKKVQEHIDQVLAKYNNKMCYDSIAEMSLLKMSFKEAMRMFPSLGNLHRVCDATYTIPELNITIHKGVKIVIPIQAIQNDEKYFENAAEFKPERFADSSDDKLKYSYMPFGEGPRACIGARLGEMQSLAGLAALLHKFTVEPGPSSRKHLRVDPASNLVQSISGGIPLKLVLRDKTRNAAG